MREENEAQDLRDFHQHDIFFMRYFLRLKYFNKFSGNTKIRYWVIQETHLLKPSHIKITLSVNGYALFVSLLLNIFLNEIREQEKNNLSVKFSDIWEKCLRRKESQFCYLLEKKNSVTFISLFVKMGIGWFFESINPQYFVQGLQSWK